MRSFTKSPYQTQNDNFLIKVISNEKWISQSVNFIERFPVDCCVWTILENYLGCNITQGEKCGLDEGPCNSDSQCLFDLICEPNTCIEPFSCSSNHSRTNTCCSSLNKCDVNEGQCSGNSDCLGNLQCGTNNCGWSNETNCCTHPSNIGGIFFYLLYHTWAILVIGIHK